MPCCQHDLSLPTYGLIGLIFVGREVTGLRTTLLFALCLVAVLLVLSILAELPGALQRWRTKRWAQDAQDGGSTSEVSPAQRSLCSPRR
jgi:hypothetical protein